MKIGKILLCFCVLSSLLIIPAAADTPTLESLGWTVSGGTISGNTISWTNVRSASLVKPDGYPVGNGSTISIDVLNLVNSTPRFRFGGSQTVITEFPYSGNLQYTTGSTGLSFGAINSDYSTAQSSGSFEVTYLSVNGVDVISGASSSRTISTTLVPGNAMWIQLDTSQSTFSLSLSTDFYYYTGLFSGSWDGNTQSLGFASSFLANTSYPFAGMNVINWSKGDKTNLFGQTKTGVYTLTDQAIPSAWLCIYNPLYTGHMDSENNLDYNGNINITCSSVSSIRVVSLSAGVGAINNQWDMTSSPDGGTYSADIDEDGNISWINDQTGDPGDPQFGGNNWVSSVTDNFNSWLDSVVNGFFGIFTGTHHAIQTLVGYGSDFMSSLMSLYAWLPGAVFSVLQSALILIITIGVLKVLL